MGKVNETGESKQAKVEDEFEPIINSDKYMAKKESDIRKIDVPERMQVWMLTYICYFPKLLICFC